MFINNNIKLEPKKVHAYNLAVASTWYVGEVSLLERFYKTEEKTLNPYLGFSGDATDSFFWRQVVGKYHKTHSGLPRLIVNRMRDLVNTGFSTTDNTESDKEVELQAILKDNSFNNVLFDKGITTESWAGYTAYKFSFDKDLSSMPLIETIDPVQLEVQMRRGRVSKYIINFKDDELFDNDGNTYYLEEVYSFIEGIPTISYNAYEDEKKENIKEQSKYVGMSLVGLDFLPIFLKNNTTTNTHPNIPFGMSDFQNSYSLFDDLDETKSQWSHKIRHANPKRFISEGLLEKNDMGEVSNFNDFETDYILTKEEMGSDKHLLDQHISKIEAEQYIATYDSIQGMILANVGLSPLTIGDKAASGLNNDGDTLRERERMSMRTRTNKLKLWTPFLEDMFNKLMKFNDYINKQSVGEYDFTVVFNEFEELTIEQEIRLVSDAKVSGVISTREAVMQLHPEYDEAQINEEIVRIKSENNIPILEEDLEGTDNEAQ